MNRLSPPRTHVAYAWVRASHTNAVGVLAGGQLLAWVDENAALFATLLVGADRRALTRRIGDVEFLSVATPGTLLTFTFDLTSVGRTSFEMRGVVSTRSGSSVARVERIVFVVVDDNGRPAPSGLSPLSQSSTPIPVEVAHG